MPQLSLIYTTFASEKEAREVSHQLLEQHLIACANILGPIKSIYSWGGSIETGEEVAVLLKTTKEKVSIAIETLSKLHSYTTPAILEIPVGQSTPSFTAWVHDSVNSLGT